MLSASASASAHAAAPWGIMTLGPCLAVIMSRKAVCGKMAPRRPAIPLLLVLPLLCSGLLLATAGAGPAATNRSGSVAVLVRKEFKNWCKRDAVDPGARSSYARFVGGIATALNVSTADVEVLQICTGDDSLCLVENATCPESESEISTEIVDLDRAGGGGAEDALNEDAGIREDVGPEMSSRMQVMFAVPPERIDDLAAFLVSSSGAVARMEILLVELPPADPAASVCEEHGAGTSGAGRHDAWSLLRSLLGDDAARVQDTGQCPEGFRCSMRREMHLGAPLCKAEVGRYSPVRRQVQLMPVYMVATLVSSITLLYLAGHYVFDTYRTLKNALRPAGAGTAQPGTGSARRLAYGRVSWEEYCERESSFQGQQPHELADEVQAAAAAEVEISRPRASCDFDQSGKRSENVDALLKQLDFALDRYRDITAADRTDRFLKNASPVNVGVVCVCVCVCVRARARTRYYGRAHVPTRPHTHAPMQTSTHPQTASTHPQAHTCTLTRTSAYTAPQRKGRHVI